VSAKSIPLKPVVVTSTVTPAPGTFTSDEGSLAVTITGADGTPRSGVSVTIDGPASDVQVTDENGCAFFGYEPVGDYNITASASGYVDPNGNTTATGTASVGSQTVATLSLSYDLAGQAIANFRTTPDNTGGVAQSTKQTSVGFSNAGVTINSGVRYFASGTPVTAITSTPTLYPFPGAYSVFAGDCANNAAPTGVTPDSLTVLSGKLDHTVDVDVPSLNVIGKVNGTATSGMTVTVKSTTSGCTPRTYTPLPTTNSSGRLSDPGYPFGTYTVCMDTRGMGVLGGTRRSNPVAVTLNALSATLSSTAWNLTTSSSSGQCP